ncbi:MAG: prolyl oligopeptidase family serine peptidase [Phycisphaerae bacterium]|nr:prolyl oligopeptidase family serine peptidase [Phycisphaerae bacterium]
MRMMKIVKKKIVLASLVLSVVVLCAVVAHSQSSTAPAKPEKIITGKMTPQKIQKQLTIPVKGQYLLYLPENYGQPGKVYPLILFLHGSGECGTNLDRVKKVGLPRFAPLRKNFPFIVLAPQCPKNEWWTDSRMIIRVMAMLDEVSVKYMVDPRRIYVTGLSMGGFGTWALLEQFPKIFAAAAPVCGSGGNPYLAGRMRNVPIRIYHGGKDRKVSILNAREMDNALRGVGGNVKLIIYPKMGHNIWDKVYTSDDFYNWLLQQRKKSLKR